MGVNNRKEGWRMLTLLKLGRMINPIDSTNGKSWKPFEVWHKHMLPVWSQADCPKGHHGPSLTLLLTSTQRPETEICSVQFWHLRQFLDQSTALEIFILLVGCLQWIELVLSFDSVRKWASNSIRCPRHGNFHEATAHQSLLKHQIDYYL